MIYPINKPDEYFTVPESVEKIDYYTLDGYEKTKTITIGKNVKKIDLKTDIDFDFEFSSDPKPHKFTIYGYSGTEAERWCLNNDGLSFFGLDW